jgi:hypothetical protein
MREMDFSEANRLRKFSLDTQSLKCYRFSDYGDPGGVWREEILGINASRER